MRGVRGRPRIHVVDTPMHPPGTTACRAAVAAGAPHPRTHKALNPSVGLARKVHRPHASARRGARARLLQQRTRVAWWGARLRRRTSFSCSGAHRTARQSLRLRRRCSRCCRAPMRARCAFGAAVKNLWYVCMHARLFAWSVVWLFVCIYLCIAMYVSMYSHKHTCARTLQCAKASLAQATRTRCEACSSRRCAGYSTKSRR